MSKFNINGHPIIAPCRSDAISIFLENFADSPFIRLVVKPWK
ncbi:MAG: hypothetical protein AB7U63_13545 [Porticoccaceae bacterium]